MNLSYKLVKKTNGELAVASELAKGNNKKAINLISSALLFTLLVMPNISEAEELDLSGLYFVSGEVEELTGGNYQIIKNKDPSEAGVTDGYQMKYHDGKEPYKTYNEGGILNIKFGNAQIQNLNHNPIGNVPYETLVQEGIIKIYKKDADGEYTIPVEGKPKWKTFDASYETIEVQTPNGEITTYRVRTTTEVETQGGPPSYILGIDILNSLPDVPFYQFNLATTTNGTLAFTDPNDGVNWNFGAIKQSSIFTADSTVSGQDAKIQVGTEGETEKVNIHMTFMDGFVSGNEDQEIDDSQRFGASTEYAGDFTEATLSAALGREAGYVYTVNDQQSMRAYEADLIEALRTNRLTQAQYNTLYNKAFKNVAENDRDYLATIHYDPVGIPGSDIDLRKGIYNESVGSNSIFKIKGHQAELNIEQNANITTSGGYVVIAEEGATVNNKGIFVIGTNNGIMRNALLSGGAKYNNAGTLVYGYAPSEGEDLNRPKGGILLNYTSDIVDSAIFHNYADGRIFIGNEGTAFSLYNDSQFTNDGKMYVASLPINFTSNTVNRMNGVSINGGTWINNGDVFVGKNSDGQDIRVVGTMPNRPLENEYPINEMHNAIYSGSVAGNSRISITNADEGNITIGGKMPDNIGGQFIQNGAGINLEYISATPETPTPRTTGVNVNNSGTITVGGYHSVGIRASGNIGNTEANSANGMIVNNGTINVIGSNSIGMNAVNGAIIYNKGTINVGNADGAVSNIPTLNHRNYGVKASGAGAEVYLTGPNSQINLVADDSVGVYAIQGATIHVNNIVSGGIEPKNNLVYYWIAGSQSIGGQNVSSKILFSGADTHLSMADNHSTLIRVDRGAIFNTEDSNAGMGGSHFSFTVTGESSNALYIGDSLGGGDKTTAILNSNIVFNVDGDNSTGVYVTSGAGYYGNLDKREGTVYLGKDAQISVKGNGSSAAVIDGNYYNVAGGVDAQNSGYTKLISDAELTDNVDFENSAIGYKIINRGTLEHNGKIIFHDNSITEARTDVVGIRLEGGVLNNSNSAEITVNGIGVDIYGTNSRVQNLGSITATNGIAALRLNAGATLTVTGLDGSTDHLIVGERDADAIRVHLGASLTTSKAQIQIKGSGAGIHFLNTDDDINPESNVFRLSGSGMITVSDNTGSGNHGTGILVEGQDSSGNAVMGSSNFDSTGSQNLIINVEENGNGIITNLAGYVYSGASVNIKSEQGRSALVVKGNTSSIRQSGNLYSESLTSPVVSIEVDNPIDNTVSFLNTGNIRVKVDSSGNVVDENLVAVNANLDKNITFVNGRTGSSIGNITGTVKLGTLDNTVTLYGGSSGQIFDSTDGNVNVILQDVSSAQGDKLFTKLQAGTGNNDILTLAATGNRTSVYRLSDEKSSNIIGFEQLHIRNNSTFILDGSDIHLDESVNQGGIHFFAPNATLQLNSADDLAFDHKVYSDTDKSGIIKTNLDGGAFSYTDSSATHSRDNFTGTLLLENATFTMGKDANNQYHADALKNAQLKLGQNSTTYIKDITKDGNNQHSIGELAFNGGELVFQQPVLDLSEKGDILAGSIHTNELDLLNSSGNIDLTIASIDNNPTLDTDKPLIAQDTGKGLINLVSTDSCTPATCSTGGITLSLKGEDGTVYLDKGELVNGSVVNGHTVGTSEDILQNGQVVANAKYGYSVSYQENLGDGSPDGIYLDYALTEVELLETGDNSFILHTVDGVADTDFKAKISGDGDLIIQTQTPTISLSGINTYTGETDLQSGHLELKNNFALGHTSKLNLRDNTKVSLFNNEQEVGHVVMHNNSAIDLKISGELTILGNENSYLNGVLSGEDGSTLNFDGAYNEVLGLNKDLSSTININNTAIIQAYNSQALGAEGVINISDDAGLKMGNLTTNDLELTKTLSGSGEFIVTTVKDSNDNQHDSHVVMNEALNNEHFSGKVTIGEVGDTANSKLTVHNTANIGGINELNLNHNGTLNFDYTNENINPDDKASVWKLDDLEIKGSGGIEKTGSGTLQLTESSAQYTGATIVKNGLLIAGSEDKTLTLKSNLLDIRRGASFLGSGELVDGSVINAGNFYVGRMENDINNAPVSYTVGGDFTNSGVINLNVKNSNHSLSSDDMPSMTGSIGNKLIIKGNYIANGGSIVLNAALNKGFDATKTDSIEIGGNVVRQGEPTKVYVQNYGGFGAWTNPDAIKIFSVNGSSDPTAFTLGVPATIGIYEYTLNKGVNDNNWYLSALQEPTVEPPVLPDINDGIRRNINPLVGGYLANMSTAFEMFNTSLHDRLGNPAYGNDFDNGADSYRAWGRIVTVHRKYKAANKSLNIKGDYYLAQVGADFMRIAGANDSTLTFGAMFGYGSSDFNSTSRTTGTRADAKIDQAISVGLYGTWYQPDGWFVDTWLQYTHFKNEVSMKHLTSNKYNSNLWSASVEVGYNFKLNQLANGDHFVVQPNAQLIYGRLSTNKYYDNFSGIGVRKNHENNLQARLGVKLFYVHENDDNTAFRPYVEANWLYNSSKIDADFRTSDFNAYNLSTDAPKSRYELKVGMEGQLSNNWSLWGNVGYQMGKDKYKGYKATLGVRYTW